MRLTGASCCDCFLIFWGVVWKSGGFLAWEGGLGVFFGCFDWGSAWGVRVRLTGASCCDCFLIFWGVVSKSGGFLAWEGGLGVLFGCFDWGSAWGVRVRLRGASCCSCCDCFLTVLFGGLFGKVEGFWLGRGGWGFCLLF